MTEMNEIKLISEYNLDVAVGIIDELKIKKIWNDLDSTCNLVGSVKTGLLYDNLDIDFHVYSDDFSIEKSFKAISEICKNTNIKEATYKNLLDEEDMCLEWHLSYTDNENRTWIIDIIHIKNESPYAGMIESVTESIADVLTDDFRTKILNLKHERSKHGEKVAGILIYEAVIDHDIQTFEELKNWLNTRKESAISLWKPGKSKPE